MNDESGCSIFVVAFLGMLVFLLMIGSIVAPGKKDIDDRTKALCLEYALRDHEKEIAPERFKKYGKEFFDSFDWYESCIDHIRRPVAR